MTQFFVFVNLSLHHLVKSPNSDGWTVIDISHDLTGDDHSEITIFNETYFSGGSTSITLWVLAWQNDQLVELQEIDMSYQRGSWPEYDFADYSGDGVEDIRITTTHFLRFGCQWDEIDLYSWDDLEPHFALQEGVAPATPLCNTSHGFERTLDLAERETLLRQVVQELTVNTAPSVDYLAFVRFHLAMLYAKEGQDDLAQHMLDALYELPLDAPLVALYTEIYESVNRSPLAMCRQLLQRSSEMMDSDMADFISELVVVGIGGDENKPYLPFVCPLRDIVRGRVISSAPLQATDPIVAMTNLGYSLTFTDTINLDADSDLEWIAILEPTAPHLVILDQTQAGWMVYWPGSKEFEHVFSPVINLTWTVKDMTDDGLNDLLVSLEYEDERRLGMTLKYQLFLIELGSGHFDYLDAEYPDQEMDLVELEPGFFVITTSQPVTAAAWKQLEGFNTEATSTYDYIRELVAAVLSPERPDTLPDDLIALINYLPPDDPEAHYLILQLTYMLGYTYEQEGREEEAIAAYLALIQQAPESPWSWLAWARLEPGE